MHHCKELVRCASSQKTYVQHNSQPQQPGREEKGDPPELDKLVKLPELDTGTADVLLSALWAAAPAWQHLRPQEDAALHCIYQAAHAEDMAAGQTNGLAEDILHVCKADEESGKQYAPR